MKSILIGDCIRKLTSSLLVVALLLVSTGAAGAEVIYVEPGASIQAAVNNSTTGDFIIVKAGEYEENIVVNVSGVTVSSEPEKSGSVFIRAGDRNSSVFQVKADNVTISGFNITGSGEFFSTHEASSPRDSSPKTRMDRVCPIYRNLEKLTVSVQGKFLSPDQLNLTALRQGSVLIRLKTAQSKEIIFLKTSTEFTFRAP